LERYLLDAWRPEERRPDCTWITSESPDVADVDTVILWSGAASAGTSQDGNISKLNKTAKIFFAILTSDSRRDRKRI
jgi:hypothetical protein